MSTPDYKPFLNQALEELRAVPSSEEKCVPKPAYEALFAAEHILRKIVPKCPTTFHVYPHSSGVVKIETSLHDKQYNPMGIRCNADGTVSVSVPYPNNCIKRFEGPKYDRAIPHALINFIVEELSRDIL